MTARRRVILVAGALAVLAVGAVAFIAVNSGYESRRIVSEAIADGQPIRQAVEDFHAKNGRLPAPTDVFRPPRGTFRSAEDIAWDPATLTITTTVSPTLEVRGRFTQRARADGNKITWECRTVDLPAKYLPAACR